MSSLSSLACGIAGFLYPAFRSFKAIRDDGCADGERDEADDQERQDRERVDLEPPVDGVVQLVLVIMRETRHTDTSA